VDLPQGLEQVTVKMAADEIRYDLLTQDALRGVVKQVLTQVQRSGLPGEHHLYIAFDTTADGVSVSKRLKEQYPEEMTVVLQYQFWDLQVMAERFEVKLSFNNVPEKLVVPFQAIKAFYDPSAQFGLQFGKPGAANDSARAHMAAALPDLVADVGETSQLGVEPHADEASEAGVSDVSFVRPPAEIVQLDRFRKK
jgi:hypothetical protein